MELQVWLWDCNDLYENVCMVSITLIFKVEYQSEGPFH